MAADAFKVLVQGQLGNSVATLYTVPAATSAVVKYATFVNNDTSARTCGVYVGGTSAAHDILPPATSIPAGGMAEWTGTMTLETAQTIAGGASVATQVTYTIFGDEIT